MILMNILVLFVECLVSSGRRWPAPTNDESTVFAVVENLDRQLKEIRGSPSYTSKTHSRWCELRKGFFSSNRADETKSPVGERHSAKTMSAAARYYEDVCLKDAIGNGNGKNANDEVVHPTTIMSRANIKQMSTVTKPTTTVNGAFDVSIYGTENECVLANNGRPCVCFMTDFLDLVGQRLDEAAAVDDDAMPTVAFIECPSYKAVPAVIVVTPASALTTCTSETTTANVLTIKAPENDITVVSAGKQVDFDHVTYYKLEKFNDDHYAVHYGLVGSDVKIQCMKSDVDNNGTRIVTYKWDYQKDKHKSNSTVTGTDKSILQILGLEPKDSKNYTCVMYGKRQLKKVHSYMHYVIVVDKPIYEIQGTAIYKSIIGGCTPNVINPVQKQLPRNFQSIVCPEGSSRYACDVFIKMPKCIEDKQALQFEYSVTLKDDANFMTRIRTSKKGRNALVFQQLLAKISVVLAANLNRSFIAQVMSKTSLIDTYFDPDYGRMKMNTFVSCSAGFGIREVFCGACPPHHFSPEKSAECQKCPRGFHQPVAGSETCVKCPNIFASGCSMIIDFTRVAADEEATPKSYIRDGENPREIYTPQDFYTRYRYPIKPKNA